ASAMHYRAAEPLLRRAVDLRSAHLGPEHPDTLASLAVLATVTKDVKLCERTLEAQSRLPGGGQSAAKTKFHLAILVRDAGSTDGAITLLRENLEDHRRVFGENDRRTAWVMHCLAFTLLGVTGDGHTKDLDDEIERLYRQALAIHQKTTGARTW